MKETLYYAENAAGYIYFASPQSDLKPGFMLKSTNKPSEMDKIFKKMHAQEREHNEKFIEKLWSRGRDHYERMREALKIRLASGSVSNAEKGIIRESLKLMDEKDFKAQQNTVYGVSAMEEAPEPLPARNEKVIVQ